MTSNESDNHIKDETEIDQIKEWLSKQPQLPQDLNDHVIHTFVVGCQGNVAFAKQVLGNYYYKRQATPELFKNRDPLLRDNLDAWGSSNFIPLGRDSDGCMIFLGAIIRSQRFTFTAFARQAFMNFDLLIGENAWGNGDRKYVLCYKQLTVENLTTYSKYMTRKVAEYERDRYLPGRLLAVHNVNIPELNKGIHTSFNPFLTKSDRKQIFFHKNIKSLQKYINPNLLPTEYMGTAGPLKYMADKWYAYMVKKRLFYMEEERKRSMESHIPLEMQFK